MDASQLPLNQIEATAPNVRNLCYVIETVCQYLIQSEQVAEARLQAIGKEASEPLNETNPAAPENRRVTIVTSF